MKIAQQFAVSLGQLSKKNSTIVYGSVVTSVLILTALLFWFGSGWVGQAQERLDDLLEQQSKVQKMLVKNVQTEQELKYINKVIDENPDFNLLDYADSVFKRYMIKPSREKIDEIRSDFYIERAAQFALDETDMKTVTEIIQLFDENERITLKEVSIKPGPGRTITVVLTIAALYKKPKSD